MALAFAERHAHELRYVAARGRWLHYDGMRWAQDDTLHAFDRARAICREIALDCDKPAGAVASAATVAAVERLAKADRRLAATSAAPPSCSLHGKRGVKTGTASQAAHKPCRKL